MIKSAALTAFADITKYFRENNINVFGANNDVLIVTPSALETKETRYLNKKLGINKVNYKNNKNRIKNKNK